MYNSASSVDSIVGSPLLPDGSGAGSPIFSDAFSALHKFLPSNKNDDEAWPTDGLPTMDAYSCDDFRMYEFKVRRCMRGRSHDWTECPFAHPGEKARRRDPRRIHYSGTACPDFRKGTCKRGDACEYAHGVFECWLHPARYRTQPCKDGRACRRRVCFFAHTVEQLRILPSVSSASASSSPSAVDGQCKMSPGEGSFRYEALNGVDSVSKDEKSLNAPGILHKSSEPSSGYALSSPAASLPQSIHGGSALLSPPISPSTSPPMSPEGFWPRNIAAVNPHLQASLQSPLSSVPGHRRHLNRLQTMPTISIPQDLSDVYSDAAVYEDMSFSLPASVHMHSSHLGVGEIMHSLQALQLRSRVAEIQKSASTPSSPQNMKYVTAQQPSLRQCLYPPIPAASTTPDTMWAISSLTATEDDPPHRVESGRDLRAKIYGKIGKDNGVGSSEDPDLGWVNELVK
ncbi:hypothetical protein KP509_05G100900 [Ceratopteris richardii]|nr:hypothetical protein KP509_05G100900 [Ceratopteris richardii]